MWERILQKKYDDIDIKIMNILNTDGRTSDQEIANALGLSKTAVRMRRIKLQKTGAIKVIGILVLQNIDLTYADAFIKFDPNTSIEKIEAFIDKCKADEYVYEITRYIGVYDVLIRLFDTTFYDLKRHFNELCSNSTILKEKILIPAIKSDKAWGALLDDYNSRY